MGFRLAWGLAPGKQLVTMGYGAVMIPAWGMRGSQSRIKTTNGRVLVEKMHPRARRGAAKSRPELSLVIDDRANQGHGSRLSARSLRTTVCQRNRSSVLLAQTAFALCQRRPLFYSAISFMN